MVPLLQLANPRFYLDAVLWGLLSLIALFLSKLAQARWRFQRLKRQGLVRRLWSRSEEMLGFADGFQPMPPHHPILGHLSLAKRLLSRLPSDAHRQYLARVIRQEFPQLGPVFYLDMWPFSDPLLIISSPTATYQVTQEHVLPKAAGLKIYMRPFTENKDLVSMEGPTWKYWRKVFNPGFSSGHFMTFVPDIVEVVSTYCDILQKHASADQMFLLEDTTMSMAIDSIGQITLGVKFDAQRTRNEFVTALRKQIQWLTFGSGTNPLGQWSPLRYIMNRRYKKIMDRYLGKQLDQRFATYRQGRTYEAKTDGGKSKTIVDLALNTYLEETTSSGTARPEAKGHMDSIFRTYAINQIKGFVFAGHDTTATALCYTFHLLSQNPSTLRQIRHEHETVFGFETSKYASAISDHPHKLNELPFTVAVLKETLRLFPGASTPRQGEPDFFLREDGRQYPTDGFMVWCIQQALHREPRYWPEPDKFIPERWLVPESDPLYPPKGAWRPFGSAPRSCIGQEFAILEIKIALVMTLGSFDITTAFGEWDVTHGKPGPRTVDGERAYQTVRGTTRGPHGFPSRVKIRQSAR